MTYMCDSEGVWWFSIFYILMNIPAGLEYGLHVWQWGGTVVKHFLYLKEHTSRSCLVYMCDSEWVQWFSIVYILKNIPAGLEYGLHV